MIAHIHGTVRKTTATYTIVDTGGVGYKVHTPVSAMSVLVEGELVSFHIHTIVKEDAIDLYGFLDELDQHAFEILISVTGVGPKTALGMISTMTVNDLATAASTDGMRLQTVPGVGKKTAQRIALEVGEKLQELALVAATTGPKLYDATADVIEGLIALGYNRNDARRAAQEAKRIMPENQNTAALLTRALALLTQ